MSNALCYTIQVDDGAIRANKDNTFVTGRYISKECPTEDTMYTQCFWALSHPMIMDQKFY